MRADYSQFIGNRFGQWSVLAEVLKPPNTPRYFHCRCDCGQTALVFSQSLFRGISLSCGCRRSPLVIQRNTSHGLSKSMEYRIWHDMKRRCLDQRKKSYSRYGGRGITIDPAWMDFAQFIHDMGPRPSSEMSLERNDNSGPYSRDNCRWATRIEQANNRRNNRLLLFQGKTQTIQQWERERGFPKALLRKRLFRGWTIERAIATPIRPIHR